MSSGTLSCSIATQRPLLDETRPDTDFQRKNEFMSVFYYGGQDAQGTSPSELMLLRRVFEEYVATRVAVLSTPPGRGLYVRVYKTSIPRSPTFLDQLSLYTLWLIPSYRAGVRYTVDYDLYFDAVLRKTYHYEITEKIFFWILVLPFSWINLLTNGHTNAFEATIHEFIRDARNEANL
jgi:hypothetical protein